MDLLATQYSQWATDIPITIGEELESNIMQLQRQTEWHSCQTCWVNYITETIPTSWVGSQVGHFLESIQENSDGHRCRPKMGKQIHEANITFLTQFTRMDDNFCWPSWGLRFFLNSQSCPGCFFYFYFFYPIKRTQAATQPPLLPLWHFSQWNVRLGWSDILHTKERYQQVLVSLGLASRGWLF